MKKNTKILLGLGAVAAVGYFVWKNNQGTKANATGGFACPRGSKMSIVKNESGQKYFQCVDNRGVMTIFDGGGHQVW